MLTQLAQDYASSRLLSRPRQAALTKLLADLEAWAGAPLPEVSATTLSAFLEVKLSDGYHPNTVRKWLAMARSFYGWLYESDRLDAEVLLAIRAIRPPAGSSSAVQPRPYTQREMKALRATLDERWPRLSPDDARRYADRWARGVSPYSRIRSHAIRLQLDAVITLAQDLGLRRSEIFALDLNWLHYLNTYVVVWRNGKEWEGTPREVPFTESARLVVHDWIEFRSLLGANHDRPWTALWSADSSRDPMKREAFEKLLRTYIGNGWTLKRLRDTCAVGWVKRGLPLEHLRELLGLASIEDTLPYARLVGGSMPRRVEAWRGSPEP